MRRISIAITLTILLLASLVTAQQTNNNAPANSQQTNSPTPPPGPIIGGMGTANYIPLWATPNFIISSVLYQDSTGKVGVGTTTPAVKLDVSGHTNTSLTYEIGGSTVLGIGSAADVNLFVGVGAGVNNVGGQGEANVFLGYDAGNSNTIGRDNVFSGYLAGAANTSGVANIFIGSGAGGSNTSGNNNTYIGVGAAPNTTGSGNTFIGPLAGGNNTTGNNNIYLGNIGCGYPCTEGSTIRIGGDDNIGYGPQTKTFIEGIYGDTSSGGIAVYINSDGRLGTATSSLRFKEQVRDMGDSTSALMKLRPVTFLYRPEYADGERTLQYGLIAEEVAKVYPDLVAYDNDGKPYSVRYQYLSTMLLNEVQKQYRRAQAEATVITAQEQKISELEQRLSRLEALVGTPVNTAQANTENHVATAGRAR